jgi:hypothetical protein
MTMAGHVDYHALLVMGAAISDMHYTGMGAMEVHDDASVAAPAGASHFVQGSAAGGERGSTGGPTSRPGGDVSWLRHSNQHRDSNQHATQ